MGTFQAEIVRAENQGAAMAGWAYVQVPHAIANQIKPEYKQVYRVRGQLDGHTFAGLALMPKGEGDYYLAVNGNMRRVLKKGVGDMLALCSEEDKDGSEKRRVGKECVRPLRFWLSRVQQKK